MANLNYAEDLAAPMASTKQRSRIRKAIQDVIPGITDADRYAVTAMLGRYRPEMFTSTRVLTVGAAHELIAVGVWRASAAQQDRRCPTAGASGSDHSLLL